MKLDVEGPDVRGCGNPEVTSAASQDMGERTALAEQLACARHVPSTFLLCKVRLTTEAAPQAVCEHK